MENGPLQALLHATVRALAAAIPGLGATVAFDVKHIYAWVEQNNLTAYVPDRYDPAQQPTGDPDCRLGVTSSSNQERAGRVVVVKAFVWGDGSGVAAATDPLAERINSQAKDLGIERPKVRNRRSVQILNTLTYIVINVRALQCLAAAAAAAPPLSAMLC